MAKDADDDWSKKLHYLVSKPLPQKVSRAQIPDNSKKTFNTIDSVSRLASVLRRSRQALYTPSQPILADIRFFYKIPESGKLARELAHGDCADFITAYSELHKDFAEEPEAFQTGALAPGACERCTGVYLARGPRCEPERSAIAGLGSVEIDGYQFGPGTANIEIIVSCGTPKLAGIDTSIESAHIELDCGAAAISPESYRQWLADAVRKLTNGRGEAVAIAFGGGDGVKAIWKLQAENGGIGTLVLEPGFVALGGLAPGDEVEVRLGTWLMDIGETDADNETLATYTADGFAILTPDGARLTVAPQTLSILKRRVAGVLKKTLIPDDNGYVIVASHILRVAEAGQNE